MNVWLPGPDSGEGIFYRINNRFRFSVRRYRHSYRQRAEALLSYFRSRSGRCGGHASFISSMLFARLDGRPAALLILRALSRVKGCSSAVPGE